MKWLYQCRRTFMAFCGILACMYVSMRTGEDTTMAIAGIVAAIAGANAYEARGKKNDTP